MDRRQVFFALALMGAFGCAQAVTIDWQGQPMGASATTNFSAFGEVPTTGATYSAAFVFTLDAAPASGPRLTLTSSANSGLYLGVGASGNGWQGRLYKKGAGTYYSQGMLHKGLNVVGIVFTVENVENGKLTFNSFDINGTTFGPTAIGGGEEGIYWTGWQGTQITLDTLAFTTATNGTLYLAAGAATGEDFALLPEPTALAVLALGVAGAALRRRVA